MASGRTGVTSRRVEWRHAIVQSLDGIGPALLAQCRALCDALWSILLRCTGRARDDRTAADGRFKLPASLTHTRCSYKSQHPRLTLASFSRQRRVQRRTLENNKKEKNNNNHNKTHDTSVWLGTAGRTAVRVPVFILTSLPPAPSLGPRPSPLMYIGPLLPMSHRARRNVLSPAPPSPPPTAPYSCRPALSSPPITASLPPPRPSLGSSALLCCSPAAPPLPSPHLSLSIFQPSRSLPWSVPHVVHHLTTPCHIFTSYPTSHNVSLD